MARSFSTILRATAAALVVALAPQSVAAELADIDLSKLRVALRAIEAEATAGFQAPADVSAFWDTLALPETDATATIPAPVPPPPPISTPAATNDTATTSDGGLFALQRQAASNAVIPTATPTITPIFGAFTQRDTPASDITSPMTPIDVGTTNFRIMLAALSQTYTGKNATAVVNAQGPRGPIALSVRAGTVTLADIRAYSTALGLAPLPDGTLTAPVVIWPDATLQLSAGERLALARDAGVFILAMGTLDINGATIEVTGLENPHTPSFTPFVTVAAGGSLIMKNAQIRGLGFGQTAKFSGLSVASNLLQQGTGQVVITDSLFDDLQTVTIAGVTGAQISGNTFINTRANTLSLINAPQSRVMNNLFVGASKTNEIRVDTGSSQTRISNNIFLSGERVAMLVMGGSDHVRVSGNIVWKRDGAGVKFLQTRCGLATDNILLDNQQKGVEVRKSDGTVVAHNLIAGNGSAGVWVSAQQPNAQTLLSENMFVANASGISAATGAEILMNGNDMTRQLPRLLDGDISRLTQSMVADLRGVTPLRLKDGIADQGIDITPLCGSTR